MTSIFIIFFSDIHDRKYHGGGVVFSMVEPSFLRLYRNAKLRVFVVVKMCPSIQHK